MKLFIFVLLASTFLANSGGADDVIVCPDKHSQCPEGTTCCQLTGGIYGCCPMPNAVCCTDHLHCCPQDTSCDIEHQQCLDRHVSSDGTRRARPFHRKFAASEAQKGPSSSESASSQSSELLHQQSSDGNENEGNQRSQFLQTTEPSLQVCGGTGVRMSKSVCPGNSKCCRHKNPMDGSKSTGCCPFANGQCCHHGPFCCPNGFACGVEEGRCVSEQEGGVTLSSQMFPTTAATKHHGSSSSLKMCPDGNVCASGTCCARQTEPGQSPAYDCCPLNKANCCPGQFCCPNGYKCVGGGDGSPQPGCQKMSVREMIAKLFLSDD